VKPGDKSESNSQGSKIEKKRESSIPSSLAIFGAELFARCLDIHINLLCTTATKQCMSKSKERNQYYDNKDRYYRYNARTSSTTTIIRHNASSLVRIC